MASQESGRKLMEWRAVVGHPNYEVSDCGLVRSIPRVLVKRNGEWRLPGKVLKPYRTHDGYVRVNLRSRHRFIHQLVLEAFVGKCPDGFQACHNNGVPSDNRLENLRWDTPRANVADRERHGTHQRGEQNHQSKLSADDVRWIREAGARNIDAARKYGLTTATIANIRSRRIWAHI